MFIAALALTVGYGLQAFGKREEGKAAERAAKANAATAEQNALFVESEKPLVVENARNERRRLAEQYHTVVGDFRARTAAGGVDPTFGSAARAVSDAKRAYSIDRNILARNEVQSLREKDREAYNYRRGAAVSRMEGAAARRIGSLNALATLLQGVGTVSNALPAKSG